MTSILPPVATVLESTPDSLIFVGERLWLDFVNSDDAVRSRRPGRNDALDSFDGFIGWLSAARVLDAERSAAMRRRAHQQPTAASAAVHEARRIRNVLRALAEKGTDPNDRATQLAIGEINRILGTSEVRKLFQSQDVQIAGGTMESCAEYIKNQGALWSKVVREAKVKAE